MNQSAVPLCRDRRAMLWFFHGSGGENQPRISSCNLSPARQSQDFLSPVAKSRNNRRLNLFISLANSCSISDVQLNETRNWCVVANDTYRGFSGHCHPMPFHLETKILNNQRVTRRLNLLTHFLHEAVYDLESFCSCHASLVVHEPVQPL